ncbi:MAG: hypothetical protein ABRQ26_01945 [Syntrophomonadaceae bacterium]
MRRTAVLVIILALIWPQLICAAGVQGSTVEGFLQAVIAPDPNNPTDYGSVKIESYDGNLATLALTADTVCLIDGRPVKLSAIRKGMEVYAKLAGGTMASLEAYSTAETGYIQPGSRVVIGTISKLEEDLIEVRRDDGRTSSYYTTPATTISKQGEAINLDDLYVGDRVKLYFDEVNSGMISRMEVQGSSVEIKNVYRGTLKTVDNTSQHLSLSDVEVLNNSLWESSQGSWRVAYNQELPVYVAGVKVPTRNLKYYRGRSVYVVTRDALGKDSIDRLVIKSQYESSYEAQIENVNWFSDSCELDNNKNISFSDGTIIIRDGRLQDKFALTAGTDAYFVTDTAGGQRIASLVNILSVGINNSSIGQNCLYAGQLADVFEDSFWLEDAYRQDNNVWQSVSGQVELFLDNDTSIWDMDNKKQITLTEFVGGDYSVDPDDERTEDLDLTSWYVYVYARGDRGACLALHHEEHEIDELRTTSGTVVSVENDALVGWVMTLKNTSDWSEHNSQWMGKQTNLRLGLENTLIIKNGKAVLPKSLKAGDRLYMVRNDFRVMVVLVK